MKRVVIMLAVALVASCSLKKKSVDTSVVKVDSVAVTATSEAKVERLVDTTITTTGRVVVTEVEFATDSTAGAIESAPSAQSGNRSLRASMSARERAKRLRSARRASNQHL